MIINLHKWDVIKYEYSTAYQTLKIADVLRMFVSSEP